MKSRRKVEGWRLKDEGWRWWWCWKIDYERLRGFGDRQTYRWADICDCRVGFATEKIHMLEGVEYFEFSVCNMFFIEGFPGIHMDGYMLHKMMIR